MIRSGRRRSRAILSVAFVLGIGSPQTAEAAASPWSVSRGAQARLLDGGPAPPEAGLPAGTWLAGVEIRLAPGTITYWRNPGDAGVPPTFDFSGSGNLRGAEVLYPAPRSIDEAGTLAFGYRDAVVFPVAITPLDPAKPVELDLRLAYAACSQICLPAKAEGRITLGEPAPDDAAAVAAALREVPVPRRLGEAGALGIETVTPEAGGAAEVEARAPLGAMLFAEAPDPWYVTVSPARPLPGGHLAFTLAAPEPRPAGPVPGSPLRLTLAGGGAAIEISLPLDAAIRKP